MSELCHLSCVPCQGGVPALEPEEVQELSAQVKDWSVVDNHHITKEFAFDNYLDGLDFVNRLATLAEEQGHHPDIHFVWGKVTVDIWTHKIDGLTKSDFILAARVDEAVAPGN